MGQENLDFDALHLAVKHKKFAPVYVFYGNEEFLIEESIKTVVENAIDDGLREFNFDTVYGNKLIIRKPFEEDRNLRLNFTGVAIRFGFSYYF